MSFGRFITWVALAASLTALVAVAVGFYVRDLDRQEARGQTCTWFEGDHLDDVQGLVNSYAYFNQQTPEQLAGSDFLAIFRQLPETEGEALQDQAPAFCDSPDTGLEEPDPCFPVRPAGVVRLARELGVPPQQPVPFQGTCRRVKSTLR